MAEKAITRNDKPYFLALTGRSGAGKSALAKAVSLELGEFDPVILPLDCYYLDLAHLHATKRESYDFDRPAALDWPLLIRHLTDLVAKRPIACPVYLFDTHTRATDVITMIPRQLVIVEGMFAFDIQTRFRLDFLVFIDIPERIALDRRIQRDVTERGRTETSVRSQWNRQVETAYRRYVAPKRRSANLIVDGTMPMLNAALHIAGFVKNSLKSNSS